MTIKELGKISSAEFGLEEDGLFGLKLVFAFNGVGCSHFIGCTENADARTHENDILKVRHLLAAAKVKNVSQLQGVPVEVTFDGNCFKSFRILTEVL